MKNPILIIDANYLGHLALYTTGPLAHKGRPTGVIYGMFSQIFTLLEKFHPSNIVFCWDSRKSHRRRAVRTYKSGRRDPEGPSQELLDAFTQFEQLRKEILPRIGLVNNFHANGYEADDLIAKIVMDNPGRGIICSSDEDLFQLLPYARMYNLGKKTLYTDKDFQQQWGIPPSKWAEVKALAGCSGDSVQGLPGIGEKTAAAYIAGTLKKGSKKWQIIENAPEELLRRNRWLVTLPLPGTPSFPILQNRFDQREFNLICRRLGFHKLRGVEDWQIYL